MFLLVAGIEPNKACDIDLVELGNMNVSTYNLSNHCATVPGDRKGRYFGGAEETPGPAAPGVSAATAEPAAGVEPQREVAPPGRRGGEGGGGGALAAAAPRLHALALLQGAAGRTARAEIAEVSRIWILATRYRATASHDLFFAFEKRAR